MTVHFIGAGPGAADLLTIRAARLISESPVCLYAGTYIGADVLSHCPPDASLVDTQHLDLDAIVAACVEAHTAGHDVARLCSGDRYWIPRASITDFERRILVAGRSKTAWPTLSSSQIGRPERRLQYTTSSPASRRRIAISIAVSICGFHVMVSTTSIIDKSLKGSSRREI